MRLDRLEWHLENWRDWMKYDDNGLGYPKESLLIQSGGGACIDAFELMCEEVDTECAIKINALIDSLKSPYKTAINHVWLKCKHCYPTQEMDYEIAIEQLLLLCIKRKLD